MIGKPMIPRTPRTLDEAIAFVRRVCPNADEETVRKVAVKVVDSVYGKEKQR